MTAHGKLPDAARNAVNAHLTTDKIEISNNANLNNATVKAHPVKPAASAAVTSGNAALASTMSQVQHPILSNSNNTRANATSPQRNPAKVNRATISTIAEPCNSTARKLKPMACSSWHPKASASSAFPEKTLNKRVMTFSSLLKLSANTTYVSANGFTASAKTARADRNSLKSLR
jgi:hypothetical protein